MGRWNDPGNFARNVMKMEMAASDMKLREQDPEQSRRDFGGRIAVHLAMLAVVLVLLVVVVVRPRFANPVTKPEKKEDFYQFTAGKMADYKPGYFLYEELSDPAALMTMGVWDAFASAMDDPETAILHWKGEGYTVQSWLDLVVAECDRLWEEWYYGTEDIAADTFILREIDRSRGNKSIPGLGEHTWLVTDPSGVQYILVKPGEKGWFLQPLDNFR